MGAFVVIGFGLIIGIGLIIGAIFSEDKDLEESGFFVPIELIGLLISTLFSIKNPKLNRSIFFSLGLVWTIIFIIILFNAILEYNK